MFLALNGATEFPIVVTLTHMVRIELTFDRSAMAPHDRRPDADGGDLQQKTVL